MPNQAGRISPLAIFLLACITVLMVGISPILDLAYSVGLYPQPTATDVEEWFTQHDRPRSVACEEGSGGWSFVCEIVYVRPHDRQLDRRKLGVRSAWQSVVVSTTFLPLDQPTPSVDEFYKSHRR